MFPDKEWNFGVIKTLITENTTVASLILSGL